MSDERAGKEAKMEAMLARAAEALVYPPTPDLARREALRLGSRRLPIVRASRLAWTLVIVLAVTLSLLFVQPVRARLIEWLRVGAVRIFPVEPGNILEPPEPTPDPSTDALDLSGSTTLADAARLAGFAPRLPVNMDPPQAVFYQELDGVPLVILVWMDAASPGSPSMALYEIGKGDAFSKRGVSSMEETDVNGDWALWLEGPYQVETLDGRREQRRIVFGHTLVWTSDGLTYRLESTLGLEEARQVAESLTPWLP